MQTTLQVGILVLKPVVETPSNNRSDSEEGITRTGCMVFIFKDGFSFLVLNSTSNRAGMVASQVFSEWQAKGAAVL